MADELRNAFVARNADTVARVALETVGPREACMIFFGKVGDLTATGTGGVIRTRQGSHQRVETRRRSHPRRRPALYPKLAADGYG